MNQEEQNKQQEQSICQPEMQSESKQKKSGFVKGLVVGILCGAAIAVITVGVSAYLLTSSTESTSQTAVVSDAALSKLQKIKSLIELHYYEDMDESQLEEGLYAGYVAGLGDDYSAYYTAEEYKEVTEKSTRQYYGIGVTLSQDRRTNVITITYVYEDTPAESAGLMEGDILTEVENTSISDMDLDDVVDMIRGEEGSTVHLTITREGTEDALEFDVERANVNIPSVDYQLLEDEIGYIQISKFATDTANEFEEAVADLQKQNMKGLIIDVRYNTGGFLNSVVKILDDILPEGTVVYTLDKYGSRKDEVSSGETKMELPIAVLVNEGSASASEILAGAIRDFSYGTLIGTTTYGKGCVQETYQLADGSAVKLTTDLYYTPSGENIQDSGITPDIELEYEFLGEEDDEYSWEFDNQILKAIEVLQEEIAAE